MRYLLLILTLLSLGLGSCSERITQRSTIRYYHRLERKHERARRHRAKTNITWSRR